MKNITIEVIVDSKKPHVMSRLLDIKDPSKSATLLARLQGFLWSSASILSSDFPKSSAPIETPP